MALRNYLYAKHSNDGVTAARINKIDPNNSKNELIEQTIESFHTHQRQLNHHHHAKSTSPEARPKTKKIKVVHGQNKMKRTNIEFYQSNDSLNSDDQISSRCHSNNNSHDHLEMEDTTLESSNKKCRNCPDCKSKQQQQQTKSEPLSTTTSPLTLTTSISPTSSLDHHQQSPTNSRVMVEYQNSDYTTNLTDLQSKINKLSIDQSNEIDFTHSM
ncbi:hypothetical protein DFJ63DRAFT_99263 [Scheffersomyces coipomensis]|uniref:uncharacterized protein n=1 Tax=Scheffersomyces coipomensis TaxID=1788519 RepID=UPI00315CEB6D